MREQLKTIYDRQRYFNQLIQIFFENLSFEQMNLFEIFLFNITQTLNFLQILNFETFQIFRDVFDTNESFGISPGRVNGWNPETEF